MKYGRRMGSSMTIPVFIVTFSSSDHIIFDGRIAMILPIQKEDFMFIVHSQDFVFIQAPCVNCLVGALYATQRALWMLN